MYIINSDRSKFNNIISYKLPIVLYDNEQSKNKIRKQREITPLVNKHIGIRSFTFTSRKINLALKEHTK